MPIGLTVGSCFQIFTLLPNITSDASAWRGLKATASHICDNQACPPGKKRPSASKSGTASSGRMKTVEIEGQPAVVTPGMRGEVLSLHDGFHLDVVQGEAIPPTAIVQFESGMALVVDERMRWERAANAG